MKNPLHDTVIYEQDGGFLPIEAFHFQSIVIGSVRSCCADRRRGLVRLISIIVELGVIAGGLGFETEAQCRDLAAMATTSIADPAEALRLKQELTTQFSLLSYGSDLGTELSPYWDELLDLVETVRCASHLN